MDGTTTKHKIVTGLCPGHLRSQSSPTPWAPRVRGQSINTTEDKGGAGTPTCATVIHLTWTQWHLRKLRLKRETPEGARKKRPKGRRGEWVARAAFTFYIQSDVASESRENEGPSQRRTTALGSRSC